MFELKNLQDRQNSYGMPVIGDLFEPSLKHIEDTLISAQHLLEQREIDINFRREVRLKLLKHDEQHRVSDNKLEKERLKNETLKKKQAEMEASHKIQMKNGQEELRKIVSERDELLKQVAKLTSKET